jgi:hypothetical protein
LPNVNTSRFCLACLLAGCLSGTAQAGMSVNVDSNMPTGMGFTTNRPWGNIGAFKPGLKSAPLPAYPGMAPAAGWYPAQQAATEAAANTEPRIEIESVDRGIYEQQNIVYTVRVVSSNNLKTLNPILPNIEGAALTLIDGPSASARQSGRGREIINKYRFKLMPLRSGEIIIPPIRFTGTHTGKGDGFSIEADAPLVLQAFPASPVVKPWLPLHDLKLREQLSQEGSVKAGTPVTLTLELTARGMLGNQLPSLQSQLQSDGFRAYRDSIALSSGITKNGTQLLGSRKETYTLIPLQDGPISLPHLSIAWWNVDTDTSMLTELVQLASADGITGRNQSSASTASQSTFSTWFWLPLLVTLALIGGFWLGRWARTRPLLRSASTRLLAARQEFVQRLQGVGKKLSPARHIKRLRLGLALAMPRSVKLWMCTRCIESEDNPATWCAEFRNRVCSHLDITAHTPLPMIAEKLIEASPQAEADSVRALVHSLDGAIYGTRPLDFPAWKKELRKQLRPHLFQRPRSRTRSRQAKTQLPALNPRRA